MKWTEEQALAINQEGSNIIVSAGAGSGKTAVLSQRVLRKVQEGVDIRNILILTFTNEAALEMKDRIRKKIKKAGIVEQLEYIDSSYITTFDAYALAMVKKYHYLLNVGKNISIIDSSVIGLEKERALEEIFLEYYAKKDKRFLKLIGDFTNRDDSGIKEAILDINQALDLKYDKEEFLDNYIKKYYQEEYINEIFKEYFALLKDLCHEVESDIYSLEGMVDEKLYLKVYNTYSSLFQPKNYDDLYRVKKIDTVQFRNVEEDVKELKEKLKDTASLIMKLTQYSEIELKNQLLSTKDYVEIILEIIKKLDEKLKEYKFRNEAFEFIDIAKMAIQIVKENDSICRELKSTYNEILIDEYQDTNDLQEMFISLIENNNVYMVGDIKQSIYRFRNANPNIFKSKYDNYTHHIGGKAINLLKNFRSREEVLNNINEIFNLIMSEHAGGVNYQNNHAMVYGNLAYKEAGLNSYDNNMEILKYNGDNQEFSNEEIEAFIIAHDILDKVKNKYQVFDFELQANRDIQFQDFCIILDRGKDMPKYKKIFEYFNIAMDVYQDSDLVNSNDLLIIKNIIGLIIQIYKKEYDTKMRYYFVSIARSFIGNLSDEEILEYIHNNTFYDSILFKKCFSLSKNINFKTPGILLQEIIEEFEIYEKLILVGNVEAGIMRLDYLLDLASNAEDLGFSIIDFKEYLEKMVETKKEIRYKEVRGVGNCVRIMNIHKSKGLEFPICYFAGFKKSFNMKDLQSRFMYDNYYGILTPYFKEGIGTLFTKTLIKNKYYQEEISEKIRLFYVALTRAKEKIIIVTPEFKKPMKQKGCVDSHITSHYRSFYDFIESISLNLSSYMKTINLDTLSLTKDYDFSISKVYEDRSLNNQKIEFKDIQLDFKKLESKHASKIIQHILTPQEAKTLEFGSQMHNQLELTNFKDKTVHNKYIDNLRNSFDFDHATIYQELEFMFESEKIEYHGIIDLMLEYEKEIKIIDYKLKNIDDEAYIKQLNVYYKYVSLVSDKPIRLYLYSILDNKIKEVEILTSLQVM